MYNFNDEDKINIRKEFADSDNFEGTGHNVDSTNIYPIKKRITGKRIILGMLVLALIVFSGSKIYEASYFVNRDGVIQHDFSHIDDYHLLVKTDIHKLADIKMPEFEGEVNYEKAFSKNPNERPSEDFMYIAQHFIDIHVIRQECFGCSSEELVDAVNILLKSKYSMEYLDKIVIYLEDITNEKIVNAIDNKSLSESKEIKEERKLLLLFQGILAIEESYFPISKPTISLENVSFFWNRIEYSATELKKIGNNWERKKGAKYSKKVISEISESRFLSYGEEKPGSFSGIYLKTYGKSSHAYVYGLFITPSTHSVTINNEEYIFYRESINNLEDQLLQMEIHQNGIKNILLATNEITEEEFNREREEWMEKVIREDEVNYLQELEYIFYGHTGRYEKDDILFSDLSIEGLYLELEKIHRKKIIDSSIYYEIIKYDVSFEESRDANDN